MFGHSMFMDDPFFRAHREHMQQMNPMFGRHHDPFLALTGPEGASNQHRERHRQQQQQMGMMSPFGGQDPFANMFQGMNSMMSNMNSMMSNMHRQMAEAPNNPNSHCYTSSTVMSYSSDGSGQPKVYQASQSTRHAPGGIREEQRTVKDSVSGTQKMSINRQLGDKSYAITKEKNVHTNDMSENKEFNNLDEDELEQFEREWRDRTNPYNRHQRHAAVGDHRRHHDHRRHRERHRAIQN